MRLQVLGDLFPTTTVTDVPGDSVSGNKSKSDADTTSSDGDGGTTSSDGDAPSSNNVANNVNDAIGTGIPSKTKFKSDHRGSQQDGNINSDSRRSQSQNANGYLHSTLLSDYAVELLGKAEGAVTRAIGNFRRDEDDRYDGVTKLKVSDSNDKANTDSDSNSNTYHKVTVTVEKHGVPSVFHLWMWLEQFRLYFRRFEVLEGWRKLTLQAADATSRESSDESNLKTLMNEMVLSQKIK
jgi:hypothetical protein